MTTTGQTGGSAADEFVMEAASMRPTEYACLQEVLRELAPGSTLEIGMANGTSTLVCCRVLRECGGEVHVAVDPFQSAADGWKGKGIRKVHDAGFGDLLEVIEDHDYNALPRLLAQGRRFDFVLIDGWHSFDHTFLDVFYADLLLRPGGVLACHDTGYPCVYRALRFLEVHKPYDRIGPPIAQMHASILRRLGRRAWQLLAGPRVRAEARARRTVWHSLGAWHKQRDHQVPEQHHVAF